MIDIRDDIERLLRDRESMTIREVAEELMKDEYWAQRGNSLFIPVVITVMACSKHFWWDGEYIGLKEGNR
jgi:hypothetical protein